LRPPREARPALILLLRCGGRRRSFPARQQDALAGLKAVGHLRLRARAEADVDHARLAAAAVAIRDDYPVRLALIVILIGHAARQRLGRNDRRVVRPAEDEENLRRAAGHELSLFVFNVDENVVQDDVVHYLRSRLDLAYFALPAPLAVTQRGEICVHAFLQT